MKVHSRNFGKMLIVLIALFSMISCSSETDLEQITSHSWQYNFKSTGLEQRELLLFNEKNELEQKKMYQNEEKLEQYNECLLAISYADGTEGVYTHYVDLEQKLISEEFWLVANIDVERRLIIYPEYAPMEGNPDHYRIVIRNIFDKSEYYKIYEQDDFIAWSLPLSSIRDVVWLSENEIQIAYTEHPYSGDRKEKEIIINLEEISR